MRYLTILHLEFTFWATWQMREQTWHNCQAADGLAKARSCASPGPTRDPNFSSHYICSIVRVRNPRPSTRRRPQPIKVARDSIASTGSPRTAVRCHCRCGLPLQEVTTTVRRPHRCSHAWTARCSADVRRRQCASSTPNTPGSMVAAARRRRRRWTCHCHSTPPSFPFPRTKSMRSKVPPPAPSPAATRKSPLTALWWHMCGSAHARRNASVERRTLRSTGWVACARACVLLSQGSSSATPSP